MQHRQLTTRVHKGAAARPACTSFLNAGPRPTLMKVPPSEQVQRGACPTMLAFVTGNIPDKVGSSKAVFIYTLLVYSSL